MKIADIRALSDDEVAKQLEAAHKELLDLRFQLATKQLVNHRRLMMTRKKIAQLNTIRRERELSLR
ncbi:MAG: 50S ribosomal protein L29 [Chloroflexi bacterium RBG_16_57_8]|nr:MAG: 50S ribosomal protein L29 [Chloroflexi bacterium RBG_16_57_8]